MEAVPVVQSPWWIYTRFPTALWWLQHFDFPSYSPLIYQLYATIIAKKSDICRGYAHLSPALREWASQIERLKTNSRQTFRKCAVCMGLTEVPHNDFQWVILRLLQYGRKNHGSSCMQITLLLMRSSDLRWMQTGGAFMLTWPSERRLHSMRPGRHFPTSVTTEMRWQ